MTNDRFVQVAYTITGEKRIAIENIKNIEKNARATVFMVSMLSMAKTVMLMLLIDSF